MSAARYACCEWRGAHTGGAPNGTRYLKSGKLLITGRDRNLLTYDAATKAFETVVIKYRLETLRGPVESNQPRSSVFLTSSAETLMVTSARSF